MSCHDRNMFVDSPLLEEMVCNICSNIMTIPIIMSCGNGCVIGKNCYDESMVKCPKCDKELFKGCSGCSVEDCDCDMISDFMCGPNCTGCYGKEFYDNCSIADDDMKHIWSCKKCRGCNGCIGAENNTPIVGAFKNVICKMSIKCLNELCKEVFQFQQLVNHQRICEFEKIKCKFCDMIEIRSIILNHESKICENRLVDCSQCSNKIKYSELKQHVEHECLKTTIICNCTKQVFKEYYESHIKDECPLTEIVCKYSSIVCGHKCQRLDMIHHYQNEMVDHLNLTNKKLGII